MLSKSRQKFESVWNKHKEELYSIFSGRLHNTLNSAAKTDNSKIPVFVFHSVTPHLFQRQLQYLQENEYQSINTDTLFNIISGKINKPAKVVVLTFDDATGSFWSTAYPLLKKYGFSAVLFVIPGLVPDYNYESPSLENFWRGECSIEKILEREKQQPLCTWSELQEMHQSGHVDIQSHSLTHSRINIAPQIIDFLHPQFDTNFYGNVNIPISILENSKKPLRKLRLGAPVYKSASRLSGLPRFLEKNDAVKTLCNYVSKNGYHEFFNKKSWRRILLQQYKRVLTNFPEQKFESIEEMEDAIRFELMQSKRILEKKFPNKSIRHLCYPWYQGSLTTDTIAQQCGYDAVYYGFGLRRKRKLPATPFTIYRISEEYLLSLPGHTKQSFFNVWLNKILKK